MSDLNSPPPFLSGKKIIIVGAGIAGLSFAISLHKQLSSLPPDMPQPSITIYERDTADAGKDRDGYSISIRSDGVSGGMQTLQKLGLLDLCLRRSVTGKQEGRAGNFCIWDGKWAELLRMRQKTQNGVPHMRISRYVLRKTLLEAVPEGMGFNWGVTCVGAVELANGKIGVQMSDGKLDECDLLIAADGSRSKIRTALRPDETLDYQGVVCFMGSGKFEGEVPRPADRDWGLCLTGTGVGLFVGAIDEHSVVWCLSYLAPEPRELVKQPISEKERVEFLREVLERGEGIPEPFETYVKATDPATIRMLNTADKLPFAHTLGGEHGTNVVYLGDANHAVSPFAGNGANMALMDGWEFAEQLCKHESLGDALEAYDALTIPRSKKVLKMSHFTIVWAHAKGWRLVLFTWLAKFIQYFFLGVPKAQ